MASSSDEESDLQSSESEMSVEQTQAALRTANRLLQDAELRRQEQRYNDKEIRNKRNSIQGLWTEWALTGLCFRPEPPIFPDPLLSST